MHLYAKHDNDRFDTGLASFEAGRAPLIVFGGGESGVPGTPTEGEWNRQRAIARGVPEGAALAAEHYRRLGFTVTPLPSDFSTRGAAEGWSWALLVPRGVALAQVDRVAKEWMGRVVGG